MQYMKPTCMCVGITRNSKLQKLPNSLERIRVYNNELAEGRLQRLITEGALPTSKTRKSTLLKKNTHTFNKQLDYNLQVDELTHKL